MASQKHPENGVFELLDQLSGFVHSHALALLLAIIFLTLVCGLGLLLVLRNHRKSSMGSAVSGLGLYIGAQPHSQSEDPPPLADPKSPPWDDQRD